MIRLLRAPRRTVALAIALPVLGVAGCGDDDDYANNPRPPAPIVVTASIGADSVSVSPREFGAGPITIVITNLSAATQTLTLQTAGAASGIRQQTGPINPRETASLKADVPAGTYELGVGGGDVKAATIEVGPERPSAQNDLLQP